MWTIGGGSSWPPTASTAPVPTGLLAFSSRYLTDYQVLFSALSLVTIPMIAVYVMFNRQVTSGLTAGTVH